MQSAPSGYDSFNPGLVNKFWPQSGLLGAQQSPYLPIVAPLLQPYQGLGQTLQAATQPLQHVAINKPQGPVGSNMPESSWLGTLMGAVDPVGGKMMGK